MPGLVHRLLVSSAQACPHKAALLDAGRSMTYAEADSLSNRLARLLRKHGLRKGDRVLMIMENSFESAVGYYGILKAGGVCVEVSDRTTPAEAAYYRDDSGARICMASRSSAKRLVGFDIPFVIAPDAVFGGGSCVQLSWDDVRKESDEPCEADVSENDLAAIVYTSGSTGRPKGVMLTHKNLCTNCASIVSSLSLRESDRVMAVLPFYYVYGKTLLNTHIMVGGSVVVNNRFAFPNSVIQDMLDKQITGFAGVPSTFAILLNRSIFSRTAIPSLRYVTQAGGAMAPILTKRLIETLGNIPLYIMYGATEASARLTCLPPERLLTDKAGSIGIPIPDVEITIRDNEGRILPPLAIGNICARGDNIMQGYWKDEDETRRAIKPWGLVTGDLGHMDHDGFIYLTGRKKDMLKIGGERVSPMEIEEALMESGMVHEAAVIGHPDEYLLEVPEAFVVPLNDGVFELEGLKSFIGKRLASHKHPKYWHTVRSLPKRPSGKIDREALKR